MLKSYNKSNTNKKPLIFGLISVFLCGMGFSIIVPIIPFLVKPYVTSSGEQAMMVTLLTSVYALCVFFAAPGLGALSDKYGRRPILLICLLGSSIGYLIFGIGGALWMLFLGRIIDGITGGNITTIFAYFSDITTEENRTKYFGWISAIVGIGTILGPILGGLLSKFGYATPLYFGATITFFNLIYGLFYMPESLDKTNRLESITLIKLNPFSQLLNILSIKNLKRILISAFLLWIPSGSFQALFSQFTMNTFNWGPVLIGLMLSILGLQDIISQSLIMPRLLIKLTDSQITLLGMISEIIGYGLIFISALFSSYPFFIIGMFAYGFGDSIFGPSFTGILSKSVDSSEQGRVHGGSQALQSLSRVIGPIIGGQLYLFFGHSSPFFMSVVLIIIAIPILCRGSHIRK
ncbi:MFS transporter [uncultured Clostridium sp.]|uniref:MFS transporter n=1 Tax=uncultured Clostridium sp. TaxID=59620 RepID=UPI002622457C|nr:MFS transporter [uncultured Clostridium sp.]